MCNKSQGFYAERDSTEADAAQTLFVDFGVPVNSLIANTGYGTEFAVALRKMKAAYPVHDGSDAFIGCSCEACNTWRQSDANKVSAFNFDAQTLKIAAHYGVPVVMLAGGGGKTVQVEKDLADYYANLNAHMQERTARLYERSTRQFVARAAYKLGRVSKRMQQRDTATADKARRAIKSQLATELRACGLGYCDIQTIISDMVEAVRNV